MIFKLNTRMNGFKNIVRVLIVSFLFWFPLISKAVVPLYVYPNGLLYNPPICQVEGVLIPYTIQSQEYLLNQGVIIASAEYKNGMPVINFDISVLPTTHPVFQFFVFLHECSHFRLNNLFNYKGTESEYETDCQAVNIAKNNYMFTDEDFQILKEHILDDDLLLFSSGMDPRSLENKNYDPEGRVENLERCINE